MRIGKFVFVILSACVYALLEIPTEMAKHYFIGRLTEAAVEKLGLGAEEAEHILTLAWAAIPVIAAVALIETVLSLYPAKSQPIFEAPEPLSIVHRVAEWASRLIVVVFVVTVLWSGYKYEPSAGDDLTYHNLVQLNNSELKARADKVASKIQSISEEYSARQREIFANYDRAIAAWQAASATFEKDQKAYDAWHLAHDYQPFFRPMVTFGATAPNGVDQPNPPPDPEPPRPIPPGPKPEPPVVTVDRGWVETAKAVQEEAAAVWEETSHRLGAYPPFFEIPKTYQPSSGLGAAASRLRDRASNLH